MCAAERQCLVAVRAAVVQLALDVHDERIGVTQGIDERDYLVMVKLVSCVIQSQHKVTGRTFKFEPGMVSHGVLKENFAYILYAGDVAPYGIIPEAV